MSERERSRSPERGDPPAEDTEKTDPPPAGDDEAPAAPQDSNGDAAPAPAPAADSGDAGKGSDEVKLYVGNLDYGTSACDIAFDSFKTVVRNPKVIGPGLNLDL